MATCLALVSTSCFPLAVAVFSLCVSGIAAAVESASLRREITHASSSLEQSFLYLSRRLSRLSLLFGRLDRASLLWTMVAFAIACGFWQVFQRTKQPAENPFVAGKSGELGDKSQALDPGLLRKHSKIVSYSTSVGNYPQIRRFFHPHPQAEKLPTKPRRLPVLVFVHGLGGSLAQFNHLLKSLVNVAPCFGVDLPGCGLSRFSPQTWEAYSHAALVELLGVAIEEACKLAQVEEVVLIGHSMGCSLAASLISSASTISSSSGARVIGLIAICPKVATPSIEQVKKFRQLLRIPTPIFNVFRSWDKRGGVDSASVARLAGRSASLETRKLQLRFNQQSKTDVWRRMAWGSMPSVDERGKLLGGLPGPKIWAGVSIPIFAVAGEADHVTSPDEIRVLRKAFDKDGLTPVPSSSTNDEPEKLAIRAELSNTSEKTMERNNPEDRQRLDSWSTNATAVEGDRASGADDSSIPNPRKPNSSVFKSSILPSPASHALLYDFDTYRTLSGLIQTFISDHIDSRLSLGWQLQHLKEANKWDVKNLRKWQAVRPVSEPIAGIFRAMKTLREVDEVHSPSVFVLKWREHIKAVIDISHESPVYNPQTLDDGGIEYHKFPTVSKIPPTPEEVKDFTELVNQIQSKSEEHDSRLIGVHCHYGFNRTGFFICSYLIEQEGYGVQQAIDEFQSRRPPGIRHEHFIDALFVRYCMGEKRTPIS